MAFASRSQVIKRLEQPWKRAELLNHRKWQFSQGGIDSKTAQKVRKKQWKSNKGRRKTLDSKENWKENNDCWKTLYWLGCVGLSNSQRWQVITKEKRNSRRTQRSDNLCKNRKFLDSTAVSAYPVRNNSASSCISLWLELIQCLVENEKQVLLRQAKDGGGMFRKQINLPFSRLG